MPDSSRAPDPAYSPWLAPTLLYLGAALSILCAYDEFALRQSAPRPRARQDLREILDALHAYALEHDGRYPQSLSELLGPPPHPPVSPPAARQRASNADGR